MMSKELNTACKSLIELCKVLLHLKVASNSWFYTFEDITYAKRHYRPMVERFRRI